MTEGIAYAGCATKVFSFHRKYRYILNMWLVTTRGHTTTLSLVLIVEQVAGNGIVVGIDVVVLVLVVDWGCCCCWEGSRSNSRRGGGKGNSGVTTTTTTTAAGDGRGERWDACLFPSEFLAFLPLLLLLSLFDDAFVVESVILTMFPSEAVFSPPGCGVGCEILITIIAIEPGASHRR